MTEEDNRETELRGQALHLALASSAEGESHTEVLTRAQAYLDFMKGTSNG